MKDVLFKVGDKVIVKSDKVEGGKPEVYVVDNPCDPTDMRRVFTNEAVEFYVRVSSTNPKKPWVKNWGYHQENLELFKE